MKPTTSLKKPAQVRAEFERKGISIAEWSRLHGVNKTLVYEILAGSKKRRCARGQSHRVAVLLGLKAGELADTAAAMNVDVMRVAA
jgi:gp16 family phage-associated protein